jgi:putative ABC transport system permease protein
MGSWGPPLRIARRTTRRSFGRTLLVAALIGLPVLGATWIGVIEKTASPTGDVLAGVLLGQADARLDVSPYKAFGPMLDRPRTEMPEQLPAQGAEEPVRDPNTFDPRPLLPAGTQVARALTEMGSVDIHGPQSNSSVRLVTGDGRSELTKGTFRLDGGTMPAKADEVAVSPSLAEYLGIRAGDTIRPGAKLVSVADKTFTVVGIARTLTGPGGRTVFATPDNSMVKPDPTVFTHYLVDLPDSAQPDALSDQLNGKGLTLLPRANIVDPPPGRYDYGSTDAGASAVMALIIGFGILEIVLLAGTAFAVGARRQTRELGLVTAAGGTPRDIRRIVLLQGLFAGLVGAGGGVLLAFGLTLAGKPLWERMSSTLFTAWQIPWRNIVVIALLGLFAGLAAAVVPAISAGRQAPLAALSGRFTAATGTARIRRPALVLLVIGIACTILGSSLIATAFAAAKRVPIQEGMYQPTVTPTGPIALVLIGITSVIAALVWMLPSLVVKVAGIARVLPLSGRLALRDAARHRHRTGPATAAIMMAVAATAAMAFAISNMIAANAEDYVPAALDGDAVIRFDAGGSDSPPYSEGTVQKVAGLLPTRHSYELGVISLPSARERGGYLPTLMTIPPPGTEGQINSQLLVVDPEYVARFEGFGPKAAAELRAGRIVLPQQKLLAGSTIKLTSDDDYEGKKAFSHPATFVSTPPEVGQLRTAALISTQAARKLGKIQILEAQYELERAPTGDELAAVANVLGHDEALQIERGYESPARLWLIGLLGAATVVTLLGVAISVSLSAAEGRADLATLAAVGAPPRRRRNLAAAQAWVLGQLGCLLGVGVGALYGYTAHAAFGSPHFMVPWQEIGGIIVAVPLFAGLLAWLLTRSQLPMVSRMD